MANVIGTGTYGSSWRAKYFSSNLQQVLRKALVAEKICSVDSSDSKYIHNPYSTQPTATVQALAGSYSVTDWTITDDTLTVTDEVIYAEHIRDFERVMENYDIMATRMDEMAYAIAYGIDKFVINSLTQDATGTYTTATGGFTSPGNLAKIIGDLTGKVMGYADSYKGLFLVLENSDITGLIQTQMASGFSYADAALNNGFLSTYGGVEIYVVRDGTFVTATIGSRSDIANSGCRVFGVKNVATYASPRNIQYEEKMVTAKTGREVATYGYVGFKLWTQKAGLIVKITLA